MPLQFTSNNRATIIALGSPRSITDPARDIAVTDYGTTGDGVTDDAAAITLAVAAAVAASSPLYFPPGTYQIGSEIDCSGVPLVYGAGRWASKIRTSTATQNGLSKNSSDPTIFANLGIRASVTKSAGGGIVLDGQAEGDEVIGCDIRDQWDSVAVNAGIAFRIIGNNITNGVRYGTNIQNTVNGDAGDWMVSDNTFNTSAGGTTAAIFIQSSGGARILNNKVIGHSYGVLMQPTTTANTGHLQIIGNNLDTQTVASIGLTRPSGSGLWKVANILGNIMVAPTGILTSGTADWLTLATIANNHITYTTNAINLNTGSQYRIEGNQFESATADLVAIVTGASWPTSVNIGANEYRNTVNRYTLNGNTGVRFEAATVVLGGFATGVNLNSGNTDIAITINSPTANYRINAVLVVNTGTTASLTTVTGGLFTTTGGGGLALAANQALAAITTNAVNTDANALSLTATVGARTKINSTTLQFRVGTAQGAAATGDVYVYIQPLP